MKTCFFFFTLICINFSCDRDAPEVSDEGLVIGEWEGAFETSVNVDGTPKSHTPRPCSGLERIIFRPDNTLNFQEPEFFSETECRVVPEVAREGIWERLRNEKYRFTMLNDDGSIQRIVEPVAIRFRQDNEVMAVQFDPVVDNGVDPPYYYETIFFR